AEKQLSEHRLSRGCERAVQLQAPSRYYSTSNHFLLRVLQQ
ncbi:hypothetical protein D920_01337, partial [Enterococcus faecalis 13-SD-W-01]